ncbi:hypothetical protein BDR04DRAFT_1150739 [Suillus decipiens]|nr:hypothetical protein BDR04DRAFT_1150739 [Suillus decipiens]
MELASSSPASSPQQSSPAFTSTTSSSVTHIEITPLDIFKKVNYPELPHNMTTALLSGSDCSLSPKLSPSLPGSPNIYLPPVEEIPYLPDVKESLLYKPDLIQSPKSPSWTVHMHERSPKRHIPYPLRPSLLELCLAKRMTGQACKPDFTPEQLQEHEDAISSGLSWMSFDTLYKVFKALLAGHEARVAAFNKALHQENKDWLKMKDKQLKKIRSLFSGCDHTEIDDNTDYLQAIYNNECEMLCAITTQVEIVSRCLGPRAKHELLASTGEAPCLPRFVSTLPNKDSIMHVLHGYFMDAGTNTDTDSNNDFGKDGDFCGEQPGQCGMQL